MNKSILLSLAIITIFIGIMWVKKSHSPTHYPSVSFEVYSPSLLGKRLKQNKTVIIVVKSPYSIWSPSSMDIKEIRKSHFEGDIALLDLTWHWDGKSISTKYAKPYFKEFGYTKEAFIIIINPQRSSESSKIIDYFSDIKVKYHYTEAEEIMNRLKQVMIK